MMDVNTNRVQFNFLKNLTINNINMEVEQPHPSTHEFWEDEHVRKSLMDYLVGWSQNPKAYVKKVLHAHNEATHALKSDDKEDEIELGFVDGLFELLKYCLAIVTVSDLFYSTLSFVPDPVQLKI